MAELVDNGDEPLPLRCHPGRTGLDGRVDGGDGDGVLVPQLFSIGAIFPLLHLTQFDTHRSYYTLVRTRERGLNEENDDFTEEFHRLRDFVARDFLAQP